MNKLFQRIFAVLLIFAIGLTTNLSGLQGVIPIYAYTPQRIQVIDGVQWKLDYVPDFYNTAVEPKLAEISLVEGQNLENKSITVPSTIHVADYTCDFQVYKLSEGAISNATIKKLTIPSHIKVMTSNTIQNSQIETLVCESQEIQSNAIDANSSIGTLSFEGCGNITLSNFALKDVSIEKIESTSSVSNITFLSDALFHCVNLKTIELNCPVDAELAAFHNLNDLECAMFNKKTIFYIKHSYTYNAKDCGVFYSCFRELSDEHTRNELIFNGDFTLSLEKRQPYYEGSTNSGYAVFNCNNLTDISFFGKTNELIKNIAAENENLQHVTMKADTIILDENLFLSCPNLKSIDITANTLSCNYYPLFPFEGSHLETIKVTCRTIERVSFSAYFLKNLIIDAEKISGNYDEYNINLKNIIFPEKVYKLNKDSLTSLYKTKNYKQIPCVYGYYHGNTSYAQEWAKSKQHNFKDLADDIQITQNFSGPEKDTIYVNQDSDVNSLNPDYLKDFIQTEIHYAVPDVMETETFPVQLSISEPNDTVSTAQINFSPLKLGSNQYQVLYSGLKKYCNFNIALIEPEELSVTLNQNALAELISGQTVSSPSKIVSCASVTCNNGEVYPVKPSHLTLESKTLTAGDNTLNFSYTYNGFPIDCSLTIQVEPNTITSISAIYNGDPLYVGDTVDKDAITIIPTYKYNEDPNLPKKLLATQLENATLENEGDNTITVKYNNLSTTLQLNATPVEPEEVLAEFDDSKSYFEGQNQFDLSTFHISVVYNNGSKKDNFEQNNLTITDNNLTIEEISRKKNYVTVVLHYTEGDTTLSSHEISIPVTPKKVTSIEATTQITNLLEGTLFPKTEIDLLKLTYNNGNTETLDKSTIDYDLLTVSHSGIIANQMNTIFVSYEDTVCNLSIAGVKKSISHITALYTGLDLCVGTYVKPEEIQCIVHYDNGTSDTLLSGYTINTEESLIRNSGQNEISVYYGALYTTVSVTGYEDPSVSPTTEPSHLEEVHTLTPSAIATSVPPIDQTTSSASPAISNGELSVTNPPSSSQENQTTSTPQINGTSTPTNTTKPSKTMNPSNTTGPTTAPAQTINPATVPAANITQKASIALASNFKKLKITDTLSYKAYTKKGVTILLTPANADNIHYQLVKKGKTPAPTKWKAVSNNKIVIKKLKKASALYLKYTDETGTLQTIHTNGFAIDKKPAKVNVSSGKFYPLNTKITFSDASGIKSAKLNNTPVKSGISLKLSGNYKLVVTDKAGNKKVVSFRIK